MKIFNKVVIIGTGLIGGSIGLTLRKKHLAGVVFGLSFHQKNVKLAKKIGAIDVIGKDLNVVQDADLVILAAPVDSIIDIASKIKGKLKKDCILIDVGSTKEKIVSELSLKFSNFIGCHPLAGSEKRGVANLGGDIFNDSVCIITPIKSTNQKALNKIKLFWTKLGAKVVMISPKEHDQALAHTSHLPHAIAFTLINAISDKFLSLSSNSLRDTTRISGSNVLLWSQIFLTNRDNLLSAIFSFRKQFAALELALKNRDKKLLTKIIKNANKKRERLG
ncbi:MAG: prephenate dehydrogenase [Candidatus Omnitrophota bacterium]